MKRLLVFLVLLTGLLIVHSVLAQDESFSSIYRDAGVKIYPSEVQELEDTYPVGTWQREVVSEFDAPMLEVLRIYPYNFLAQSPEDLARRQALVATYLDSVGMREVIQRLDGVGYATPSEIVTGKTNGELVEVDGQGMEIYDPNQPILINESMQVAMEDLIDQLVAKNLIGELRETSCVRSTDQNRLLAIFGFPVAPEEWGTNPSSRGLACSIAVAGDINSGGAYDQFLNSLDRSALERVKQQVNKDQVFPTIEMMIKEGAITDQNFLDAYNILLNSDFQVIDLTGFYSIIVKPDGTFIMGTVNPVFVLVPEEPEPSVQ